MAYFEQLHPWCITRSLPNLKGIVVARFRRRNDAEAHLLTIKRLLPTVKYTIIFDAAPIKRNPTQERE